MEKHIIIGNISTIIKIISLAAAGFIFGLISAFGLKLPFNEYELSGVIGLIIGLIFSYIDAKYPNTFFNKTDENVIEINIDGLTTTQVTAINNFIENAIQTNINHSEYEGSMDITDLDPASEYEQGEQ